VQLSIVHALHFAWLRIRHRVMSKDLCPTLHIQQLSSESISITAVELMCWWTH